MGRLENYNGSTTVLSGLVPINNNDFALVTARDVMVADDGTRLDAKLTAIENMGKGPPVVQTTGNSITDVMSQKSVTDALNNVSHLRTVYIDLLKDIFGTASGFTVTSNTPFEVSVVGDTSELHLSEGLYSVWTRYDVGAPYWVTASTVQHIALKSEDMHAFTLTDLNVQLIFSDTTGKTTLKITTSRNSLRVTSIKMARITLDDASP